MRYTKTNWLWNKRFHYFADLPLDRRKKCNSIAFRLWNLGKDSSTYKFLTWSKGWESHRFRLSWIEFPKLIFLFFFFSPPGAGQSETDQSALRIPPPKHLRAQNYARIFEKHPSATENEKRVIKIAEKIQSRKCPKKKRSRTLEVIFSQPFDYRQYFVTKWRPVLTTSLKKG